MSILRTSMTMAFVSMMALALVACGFKLRGSLDISQELSPLYLQQNSVFELGRELKSILSTNGIEVAKNDASANASIILHNEGMSNRVLSVDGSGQAREYQLTYTVSFSIVLKGQQAQQAGSTPVSDMSVAATETADTAADDGGSTEAVEGKQQLKVDTVTLNRTLLFQQDAVLAVTNESEFLYQDMRKSAARMILLRLQAQSQQARPQQTEAQKAGAENSAAPASVTDTESASDILY